MTPVEERLRELLASVGARPGDDGSLDLSSLQVVSLVCAIEEAYDLLLGARDVTRANFGSLAALARMVEGKRP